MWARRNCLKYFIVTNDSILHTFKDMLSHRTIKKNVNSTSHTIISKYSLVYLRIKKMLLNVMLTFRKLEINSTYAIFVYYGILPNGGLHSAGKILVSYLTFILLWDRISVVESKRSWLRVIRIFKLVMLYKMPLNIT